MTPEIELSRRGLDSDHPQCVEPESSDNLSAELGFQGSRVALLCRVRREPVRELSGNSTEQDRVG